MAIELCVIDYSSPNYNNVLSLRQRVLREPLGLNLFDEDLREDRDQYIIIAKDENDVVACLMLKILDKDTVKIRQMAVDHTRQGMGYGHTLIKYAENFCILNEYSSIELHARKTAIPFYEKSGYTSIGDEFMEVGIPHIKMIKHLQ
ncbi:MAG: GNAT family N-acetyltransferase [Bacteroidetes bacterium]|nr:GNAT family N-acetyltransferase [Bacteroidota bacterium]